MTNTEIIYNRDTFDYDKAKPGDLVTEEIVDDCINCMPPACMRSNCTQMGEPYSHRLDENTGNYRPVFATFKRVRDGVWEYCGNCFRGENKERGEKPVYV